MAESMVAQRLVFPTAEPTGTHGLYVRGDAEVLGRVATRISARGRASFATYFNAFPWGAWSQNTKVRSPGLQVHIDGAVTLTVHCVTTSGARPVLLKAENASGEVMIGLSKVPADATWLWFEVEAGADDAVVSGGQWTVNPIESRVVRPVVSITTMNRVDDCRRLLRALASDGLPDVLATVFVIDQGTDRVGADVDLTTLAPGIDLRVIEQDNLGGSGGFSRGMIESLGIDATHVLLLDDDVILEPESVRRMCAFASVATGSPLVGAQMLSLVEPTVLHSMGEVIERSTMWWTATEPDMVAADLVDHPIEVTAAFFDQKPVDFNGWWMCLIALDVVREIGVALPFFIKWDDAEYGLRAARAGHRTVTLPGAALWHVPWSAKDDGLDWQAYFQLRNRIITALIHSSRPRRVLSDSWRNDLNHLIGMQYGAAEVRCLALRDVLSGPGHLGSSLRGRRGEIQRLLDASGQSVVPDAAIPTPTGSSALPKPPVGPRAKLTRAAAVVLHQTTRPRSGIGPRIRRDQGRWWLLGVRDGAIMESATGSGAFLLRRSRSTALRLLWQGVRLRVLIWMTWGALARRYRRAAIALSHPTAWTRHWSAPVRGR